MFFAVEQDVAVVTVAHEREGIVKELSIVVHRSNVETSENDFHRMAHMIASLFPVK